MLSTFMVNDQPDSARFLKVAGSLVAGAAKASREDRPRVAVCGECAPTLWEQGKADAAIEVEHLWGEITKNCNVDILCGYVLSSFQREQESHIYERICAKHSSVSPRERAAIFGVNLVSRTYSNPCPERKGTEREHSPFSRIDRTLSACWFPFVSIGPCGAMLACLPSSGWIVGQPDLPKNGAIVVDSIFGYHGVVAVIFDA